MSSRKRLRKLCRGIRHISAFGQPTASINTLRCKPCERLCRRVQTKGHDIEWLKEHLRDGSIRNLLPEIFKVQKHGRTMTTCISPDADKAWSGDELEGGPGAILPRGVNCGVNGIHTVNNDNTVLPPGHAPFQGRQGTAGARTSGTFCICLISVLLTSI